MMEFGIFRRMEDKFGELLLHFDEAQVKEKLLERLNHRLPSVGKKKVLPGVKEKKSWSRDEVVNAFGEAWSDVVYMLKKETIRIS